MALEDYKDMIAIVATTVTIIQFLSGIDICRKIIKQGSTGNISGFPFVGGVFSTTTWLTYSILLMDVSMSVTNAVGLLLQVCYVYIYVRYCVSLTSWIATRRQMLLFFTIICIIQSYVFFSGEAPELMKVRVGMMCCLGSIIFCASPLISLKDVFQTQSTEMLPFPLIFATFLVTGLWWLYGIVIQNSFVQYPNMICCAIAGFQLLLFIVYPNKKKGELMGEARVM
ncbi:sugar transporter SWEET1 [Cherax quadricarinatus]|nr:sugar transporter SWEET1-like [Cherax quadricarinatus]XP_053632216.1 sugar transporter SWEET1-like [Cherax quadricarinatus]XP_053632217.1 sugar transporter SWEET1-like [Cherax quadricarinatus]XP_053632218.1 sugar transporter SWEET1-like [Cherax quadricarinatus]XP_053632219.1 sugar transporter SWEET1-like [Cherax quadricarinatus]